MADWGFRSPSVHKSVPGVAETPHTRSQDDYGQLGRYPLDKPQGSIAPFTGYHPISLLFIYEFVDWWDGMSCIVITCLVQWFCADVLAWAGFREVWWWPASESNWKKMMQLLIRREITPATNPNSKGNKTVANRVREPGESMKDTRQGVYIQIFLLFSSG